MENTLSLFDAPYQAHSATSKAAAESIRSQASTMRERVLQALTRRPMTDDEGATTLDMNPSTYRPRRIELERDGLIAEVGKAKTKSGRQAVVWGIAPPEERSTPVVSVVENNYTSTQLVVV